MQGPHFEPWFILASRPSTATDEQSAGRKARYALGLTFIMMQCIVWICASVTTQYLYGGQGFHSPFLMTFAGVGMLAIFLPVRLLAVRIGIAPKLLKSTEDADPAVNNGVGNSHDEKLAQATSYHQVFDAVASERRELSHPTTFWNHRKHALAALHIAPAMFFADWCFNHGLAYTSVASSTVLVSTSCVFVFLFAVLVRVEAFHTVKLAGVLLAVAGTVLTTMGDIAVSEESSGVDAERHVLTGDLFSLMAAIGYAFYTVQVRVLCPQNEDLYSMQLLLGYVGVVATIPLLPVACYALTQVTFTPKIAAVLVVKGLLDFVITDYLLFRSVILTNATTASVGLGLTIPLAFLVDWVLGKGNATTIQSLLGPVAIAIAFLIVNLTGNSIDEREQNIHDTNTPSTENPQSAGVFA
jgi:solute carrier family 35 protein F5